MLKILAKEGKARTGLATCAHGSFQTPAFMPVGTRATVKGITPAQLNELGAEIVLANTYHLHLRPGEELIKQLGGIQKFMGWSGPVLTDSGGFQVYSLARLSEVSDQGVVFQSHLDGSKVSFTPSGVVRIQEALGVDIMMVLDECLSSEASKEVARRSWERTLSWAEESLKARTEEQTKMFAIVQGGMFEDLRVRACEELSDLDFDGFAIGGLSVGESREQMRELTEICAERLPEDKIRYLMGVGSPLDLVQSIALGVDLFDCVMPTRSARFGRVFSGHFWLNLRNTRYRQDPAPIEEGCDCYSCKNFSRAYISHLIHAKEMLGVQLASLHNLRFYQRLMQTIRNKIKNASYDQFAKSFSESWLCEEKDYLSESQAP